MQKKEIPITQRGDLTEEQWERIESYLPCHGNGRPFRNIRATLALVNKNWTRIFDFFTALASFQTVNI